jgi:thymidine phosphorylase
VLEGGGPADLVALTVALAEVMVSLAGVDADPGDVLRSGRTVERWQAMVRAQGGDPDAPLAEAPERRTVDASRAGVFQRLDARGVGVAAWRLGAGRARKEDPVSAAAGVVCLAKPGDRVEEGQPLLELHADDPARFAAAVEALDGAIVIGDEPPEPAPLIIDRIVP